MRLTVTDLRLYVNDVNIRLEQEGCRERCVESARNGYQAVDQYSVNADGVREGTHVDRNIECGTSREVANAVEVWMYQCIERKLRQINHREETTRNAKADQLEMMANNTPSIHNAIWAAVKVIRRSIAKAAKEQAAANAKWHDDPSAEDYEEYHASHLEQYPQNVRDAAIKSIVDFVVDEITLQEKQS